MAGKPERLFLESDAGMSLALYRQNRQDLIEFYKKLARMNDGKPIPQATRSREADSTMLQDVERLIDARISALPGALRKMQKKERDLAVARLAVAMFVIGRAKEARDMAMRRDSLSIYAPFTALRNRVCEMLSPAYYEKSPDAMIREYLDTEPLLTACSELCGLSVPPLADIIKTYQQKLADRFAKK